MQVEYDPRSESFRVWVSNEKEYHFMRLLGSPAFDPLRFLKCNLNSIYGKMVTETGIYADTDSIKYGKENDKMTKSYIVIHEKSVSGDIRIGIVFTAKIAGIIKGETGKAIILLDSGYNYYCEDKYDDIVKQLV